MGLRLKKLKVDISTSPRQNSLPVPIISSKADTNNSFPPVKGEEF